MASISENNTNLSIERVCGEGEPSLYDMTAESVSREDVPRVADSITDDSSSPIPQRWHQTLQYHGSIRISRDCQLVSSQLCQHRRQELLSVCTSASSLHLDQCGQLTFTLLACSRDTFPVSDLIVDVPEVSLQVRVELSPRVLCISLVT